MALTAAQQTAAVVVLDASIPTAQTVGRNGRYIQVIGSSSDGTHTCGLDEYLGPRGVGYTRWVERLDDTGARWRYEVHTGPETERPSGAWRDATPRTP